MRKLNFLISCITASLMLAGCTTTEWHKPGINNAGKNKAITRCKTLALEKLPPDNNISSENNDGDYEIKGDRISIPPKKL
ncbi:hypothetical protein M4C69_25435 [Klebsiella pneumoniae]|nr:hypothetical protein [Klebsiella pneumoniae]